MRNIDDRYRYFAHTDKRDFQLGYDTKGYSQQSEPLTNGSIYLSPPKEDNQCKTDG